MLKPLAIAALASLTLLSATAHAETAYVAITQIVEHPALDSVRKGVQDELAAHGYTAGQNLTWTYESAQGNVATAAQIARKFAGASPNVIVAIATPSAQTMVAAARNTPVIFSAVTDPLAAKLVTNMEKPGGNVTGITDMLPLERHIELMLRIKPDAKRIGTVYNPGEANAAALVEQLEAALKPRGITLIKAAATRTSEVLGAARSLVGKVDLIYLTTDNTVISAAEAVISVGEQARIPVMAADTDTVKRGAIAALGFDYYDVGRQTGTVVLRVLGGEAPGEIPVQGISKLALFLNPGAAERMGTPLPEALLKEATEIISSTTSNSDL